MALAGLLASALVAPIARGANNPPLFDPRGAVGDPAGGVSGGLGRGADPALSPPSDAALSANPLWAIPIGTLSATRERPIFIPSRRPPTPPAVAAPRAPPAAAAVAPSEPEQPPLSLVGIVAGVGDGYAVFVHSTSHDTVRLRKGEGHEGWILTSVKGREAVLEKNRQSAVMALPPAAGDLR
ncbi:MAG: hypothetical protein ACJ8F3_01585 [Xanthobacteraceae bacterium]